MASWSSLWSRSPLPEPEVRNRLLVIHDRRRTFFDLSLPQGLFGEFFSVLGALRYATRHGALGVRAEFTSDYYLDPPRGPNWWAYFCDDTMWLGEPKPNAPQIRCQGFHRYGPYAWNEPWTVISSPRQSHRRPFPIDSTEDLRDLAILAARHIRVKPEILDRVAALRSGMGDPDVFLIGLHLRGTDKIINYPHRTPALDTFAAQVERVLAARRPLHHRVLVATDSWEVAEAARARFGDRCFLVPDSPRLKSDDPHSRALGVHKHPTFGPRERAESAWIDALLLAGCDYLIKNRSALSDAALVLNPKLPWTFILDDEEIHHGASADGSVSPCP